MGADYFCVLDEIQSPVDARRRLGRLAGEHLELCDWTVAPGEPHTLPLDRYAECFVVPLAGALRLGGAANEDGETASEPAGAPGPALERGSLAYWSAARGPGRVSGADCRYLVVGWPDRGMPAPPSAAPRSGGAATGTPAPPSAAHPQAASAPDPAPIGQRHGAWDVYRFEEALVPAAVGWRFCSVDGDYLTVGCSYREAPPPAREQPHSHEGEQINVPLVGRFAFTVGGHTETIAPGWAALTPRGVTHTGLHVEFPYFQLIFATPPRGRDYAEFLRSIYRASA